MSRELSVILYEPTEGEYRHWSLFLENDEDYEGNIYEIVGDSTNYSYNILRNKNPKSSSHYFTKIGVIMVDNNKMEELENILSKVEIKHNNNYWCCRKDATHLFQGGA